MPQKTGQLARGRAISRINLVLASPNQTSIMEFKISTLNLCLGLPNKKNLVKNLLNSENLDVLCLQETELLHNLDHNLMSLNGYVYESEINCKLSRVGVYLKSEINYVRRFDLEGRDLHLIVIDVRANKNLRIITIYRSFNPQDGQHPRTFFNNQLEHLKAAINSSTILLGDFNLDLKKRECMVINSETTSMTWTVSYLKHAWCS